MDGYIVKTLLLILVLASGSGKKQPDANCDLIELNHFYSEDTGKHAYDQWVLYEYCPSYRRHNVVAWAIANPMDQPVKQGEWWKLKMNTFEGVKDVRARMFRETHTTVDPERINKKLHDEKLREGFLRKPNEQRQH